MGTAVKTIGVGGALGGVVSKSANYTILDTDGYELFLITTGSSADVAITLPVAANNIGRRVTFKKVDTGTKKITITRAGGDTIDGGATTVYCGDGASMAFSSLTLTCDGTVWRSTAQIGDKMWVGAAVNAAGTVNNTSFAALATNSITLTFTPTRTGNYKISYGGISTQSQNSTTGAATIAVTTGAIVAALAQCDMYISTNNTATAEVPFFIYRVDTLTSGVTYTYTLQMKAGTGTITNQAQRVAAPGLSILAEALF